LSALLLAANALAPFAGLPSVPFAVFEWLVRVLPGRHHRGAVHRRARVARRPHRGGRRAQSAVDHVRIRGRQPVDERGRQIGAARARVVPHRDHQAVGGLSLPLGQPLCVRVADTLDRLARKGRRGALGLAQDVAATF
jgi:hypothetical protein